MTVTLLLHVWMLRCNIPFRPSELEARMIELKKGQTVSLEHVVQALVRCGYVYVRSELTVTFAVRGGILDFFTPDASYPVRIEFWGDEIDTMGLFDLESQRRTETVDSVMLAPSVEVLVDHPAELADKIEKHASSLRGKTAPKAKEIMQMECDQLRNGRHFHCADKYITMLYDRTATLLDYFSLEDTLVFVSEFHERKRKNTNNTVAVGRRRQGIPGRGNSMSRFRYL